MLHFDHLLGTYYQYIFKSFGFIDSKKNAIYKMMMTLDFIYFY